MVVMQQLMRVMTLVKMHMVETVCTLTTTTTTKKASVGTTTVPGSIVCIVVDGQIKRTGGERHP